LILGGYFFIISVRRLVMQAERKQRNNQAAWSESRQHHISTSCNSRKHKQKELEFGESPVVKPNKRKQQFNLTREDGIIFLSDTPDVEENPKEESNYEWFSTLVPKSQKPLPDESNRCHGCNKVFKNLSNHKCKKLDPEEPAEEKESMNCASCNKKYKSKKGLLNHFAKYDKSKVFQDDKDENSKTEDAMTDLSAEFDAVTRGSAPLKPVEIISVEILKAADEVKEEPLTQVKEPIEISLEAFVKFNEDMIEFETQEIAPLEVASLAPLEVPAVPVVAPEREIPQLEANSDNPEKISKKKAKKNTNKRSADAMLKEPLLPRHYPKELRAALGQRFRCPHTSHSALPCLHVRKESQSYFCGAGVKT
jgi:uncharacterized protein with PIN domain